MASWAGKHKLPSVGHGLFIFRNSLYRLRLGEFSQPDPLAPPFVSIKPAVLGGIPVILDVSSLLEHNKELGITSEIFLFCNAYDKP
ncbi:MAG: hypothetical protein PVH19_02450, partial [Planctomycetia bacterium]